MRTSRWSVMMVLIACVFPLGVSAQTLDRNAQRFVNDATKDLKNRDVQKRVDAVKALATWGKVTTAPLIIGALKDADARVRAAAADALWDDAMKTDAARAPLTAALDDPAPDVAVLAAGALRVLGATRADVQRANERGLTASTDPRIRFLAARALIGTPQPARLVSPLVSYLERQAIADERSNMELAEKALGELRDTKDRTVLVPLAAAIPNIKKGAHVVLRVLGAVQPRPAGWTALLASQAIRPDADVRRACMLLMRDLKTDAEVGVWSPVASRLLATDADEVVRSYAASALQFAGGSAHPHAEALLTAARQDRSAGVRESAFDALVEVIGRTGTAPMAAKTSAATTALPVIQNAIATDREMDVRESAIDALDALALDAPRSASLLVGLATNAALPEGLRAQALAKLRNRGPEARSAVADIQKLKSDSSALVRERATEALERIGTAAAPAGARGTTAPAGRSAAAAPAGRGASAPAAATPSPEAEARGLSIIRARKIEFVGEQFYKALGDADVELARAFLDAGMSARNAFAFSSKETPLAVAVSGTACDAAVRPTAAGTVNMVQLLVARGADASITDENGNTPLMMAASGGCDAAIMNALLKAGARLGAVNKAGLTAFEFGLFSGHDGLDALVAAGYRLPAAKAKMYLDAYKANPKAVALIKRATP